MHDLAVIVPTRNRSEILGRNLRRTRAHFPDAPIYVFDDASEDATSVSQVVSSLPGVYLFRSNSQVGPAGARRHLIELANARWCLAIDDDCYPRSDFDPRPWIQMEPTLNDPIVISLRYLRSYDGEITPAGNLAMGPCRTLLGGASLLHRKSVIAIGNYDSRYVFGGEDTDLARRIWATGRQMWIDPNSYIVHDHVASGRDLKRESFYYVRNRIILNVLSLPLWYGLPLGIMQAARRISTEPYKISGMIGLAAGLAMSPLMLRGRRPLSLCQFRRLNELNA